MKKYSVILAAAFLLPSIAFAASHLNDAEIAGIVVAANEVDMEAGRYAQANSTNDDVKVYARRMAGEHTDVNESAKKLVSKLNVKRGDCHHHGIEGGRQGEFSQVQGFER